METDTVTAPDYWASYLINGDASGLDDHEQKLCDDYFADLESQGWHVVDVARDETGEAYESRFTWMYSMYGGNAQGGSVIDYVILR